MTTVKNILLKCCNSYKFKFETITLKSGKQVILKSLRLEPRGLYGYMDIIYCNTKDLKDKILEQVCTTYIF